nr:PilN domain-containing protein [Desulfofundulus thermobenzoicus]
MIGLRPALAQSDAITNQTQTIQQWNAVLESFTPLPTTFELDDLRYAIPKECWLTALETMGQQVQAQAAPVQQGQSAQQSPPGQNNTQQNAATLPPAPAGFKIEGYSTSVSAIAAFRDNLSKLPWATNPKIVTVVTDNNLDAYKFTLSVGVKGGTVLSAVNQDTGNPVN